jgi:hypothetical protein
MAHHCTKCELVFVNRGELEDHLAVDHGADRSDATGAPGRDEGVPEPVEESGAGTGSVAPESAPEPPPNSSETRRGWLARLLGRRRD